MFTMYCHALSSSMGQVQCLSGVNFHSDRCIHYDRPLESRGFGDLKVETVYDLRLSTEIKIVQTSMKNRI